MAKTYLKSGKRPDNFQRVMALSTSGICDAWRTMWRQLRKFLDGFLFMSTGHPTSKYVNSTLHAFVLLLFCTFFAENAVASCGDYLFRKNVPPGTSMMTDHSKIGTAVELSRSLLFSFNTSGSVPCSGPGCGKSNLPLHHNPAITPSTSSMTDVVLADCDFQATLSDDGRQPVASDAASASGFPRLIEIPPEHSQGIALNV